MKKALIILALISALALTLFGCSLEIFDLNQRAEITNDYLSWSGLKGDIEAYEVRYKHFGTYGDSVAIYFHTAGAYETPVEEEIAGYTFSYPDSRVIRIWNNGRFYKMPEAYELGFITEDDVKVIKFKSQFLKFKEPYFIYEERLFPEPDFSDPTLVYCALNIALDKGISREGKEISKDYFADIPLEDELYPFYASSGRLRIILYFPEMSAEGLLEIIDKLYRIDGIMGVYPIYIPELNSIPNDPYYTDTEEYDAWALDKIGVENVWDFTTGSSEVRVGIIDTGIASHEDLNDNYSINDAFDFRDVLWTEPTYYAKGDSNYHGTHVAGIIGGIGKILKGVKL